MTKVTVYTMEGCPYCERAKALLTQRGIDYQEKLVPLDNDAEWERLYKLSGMKTMPQIFCGDILVGGYTELAALDAQNRLSSLK